MKNFYFMLVYILLFTLIAQIKNEDSSGKSEDLVRILNIATSLVNSWDNSGGSLYGGTTIYIKATGLDQEPSNNLVLVGIYPCIVDDKGVKDFLLSCDTTNPKKAESQLQNLPITIQVANKAISVCQTNSGTCNFSYKKSLTPILNKITPRSAYPASFQDWNAVWKVDDVLYIEKMMIGNYRADRFNIVGQQRDQINSWGDVVTAQVPFDIPAGYYRAMLQTERGIASNSKMLSQYRIIDNQIYDIRIIPNITSINQKIISTTGTELSIEGLGFGFDQSKISVIVAGKSAEILEFEDRTLKVKVSPTVAQLDGVYLGGSGIFYQRYDLKDLKINLIQLKTKLDTTDELKNRLLEEKIIPELQTENVYGEYYGQVFKGIFKAPKAGNYRFLLSSDDSSQFYLHTKKNVVSTSLKTDTNDGLELIAEEKWWNTQGTDNFWYRSQFTPDQVPNQASKFITLSEGEERYFEIYHQNNGGPGLITVGLEIENNAANEYQPNSIQQTQKIQFTYQTTFEKISYSVYNSAENKLLTGTYKLRFVVRNGNTIVSDKTSNNLNPGSDSQSVQSTLENNCGYKTEVLRKKLDASGNEIADDSATFAGYKYIITFKLYRGTTIYQVLPTIIQDALSGGTVQVSTFSYNAPSNPISGTFGLTFKNIAIQVKNNDYNIPFDIETWELEDLFDEQIGTDKVLIYSDEVPAQDGRTLYIYFRGLESFDLPLIQADNTGLLGGTSKPAITVALERPASRNQLYYPIPSEALFLYYNKPQVVVKVEGIASICSQDCSLTFSDEKTITIQSFTKTSTELTLTVTNPGNLIIDNTNTVVRFGENNCFNVISTSNQVKCTFESMNNQPIFEAGQWKPELLYKNVGFAKLAASIVAQDILPVISTLTPNTIAPNGGARIIIAGTGFPRSLDSSSSLKIEIGTTQLSVENIISVNNQQIVIVAPSSTAGTLNIKVTVNEKVSNNLPLTYDNNLSFTITSLNLHSASPIEKSCYMIIIYFLASLTIVGTNFGTVKSDLTVELVQKNLQPGEIPRIYELNINSIANQQLVVTLGGGRVGQYDLRIKKANSGFATVSSDTINDFAYEIKVTNVTPNSGSIGGGTKLTITGENFKKDDTLVFIGDGVNMICKILTMDSTTIQCITPPSNGENEYNSAVVVRVVERLTEESNCVSDSCKFFYDVSKTPTVIIPTSRILEEDAQSDPFQINPEIQQITTSRRFVWTEHTQKDDQNHLKHFFSKRRNLLQSTDVIPSAFVKYKSGDQVTLTGTKFASDVEVYLDSQKLTLQSSTATTITFTFPVKGLGHYQIRVKNPADGYALGTWYAKVDFMVTTLSPDSGSRGGQLVTINGEGFDINQFPTVLFGKQQCPFVQVVSTTSLLVRTPQLSSQDAVGKQLQIIFKNPTTLLFESLNTTNTFTPSETTTTPKLSYRKSSQDIKTPDSFTLEFVGINLQQQNVKMMLVLGSLTFEGTNLQITQDSTNYIIKATFTTVPAGIYDLVIQYDDKKYVIIESWLIKIKVSFDTFTVTNVESSFGGGPEIIVTGKGFSDQTTNVEICGFPCKNQEISFTRIKCNVPKLSSEQVNEAYQQNERPYLINPQFYSIAGGVKGSNNVYNKLNALTDRQIGFASWLPEDCYIDFDFGDERRISLSSFRYYPQINKESQDFINSKWQYSIDGTNFIDLFIVDSQVHSGWNFYVPTTPVKGIKILRFVDSSSKKTNCLLTEVEIFGWVRQKESNPTTTDTQCGVNVVTNGVNGIGVPNAVIYKQVKTPRITNVTPQYGPSIGNTELTITGSGFGTIKEDVDVKIDNVACTVTSVIDGTIKCTTGNRDAYRIANENYSKDQIFEVSINKQNVLAERIFIYANSYSNEDTWGGDIPPRDGDTIFVPKGQVLLLDQSTPKLDTIIVEGGIIFKDGVDITLDATYFIIRMGYLQIGTESQPHQSKVTITLHGTSKDIQIPSMGSKMIGCHECTLDIHGKTRNLVWTLMSETAQLGATQIKLSQQVDWQPGEEIVIASSDWQHLHSERRIIKTISQDGKTITFDEPLLYQHYSAIETYQYQNKADTEVSEDIDLRIEVGLLSRNIVIQGDSDSIKNNYGAHLMLHGKSQGGLIGRIEYAEFRFVGQPAIIGRYPIHFHMNGEVADSYVRGNSIHDSLARCVTIHGVHYLRVQNNVGFNARGHNIFLEDGIETNNIIEKNLMIGSRQSWIMLQTDITTASYWITNPYNRVNNNRAAGSEWYGLWYEIKSHPDGPSATADICPPQIQILECKGNTAHSNGRFGLRIFEMHARMNPCLKYEAEQLPLFSTETENPLIESVFSDFVTWKNREDGVLGELLGSITFRNFKIADSKLAGFEAYKTNYSSQGATIENFMIVGKSKNPAPDEDFYHESRGIIAPRTDGFHARNVRLYNFDSDMILLQSCSVCWHPKRWVQGGKTSDFEEIYKINSDQAKIVFWENWRREVFQDKDGTISGLNKPADIGAYKKHIDGTVGCESRRTAQWNDTVICDTSKSQLRSILFNKIMPYDTFDGTNLKILRLNQYESNFRENSDNQEAFQEEFEKKIKSKDIVESVASIFATGQIYNVHWHYGIEFKFMGIQPTPYWTEEDLGVVLRFNYSSSRDKFKVQRLVDGEIDTAKVYGELTQKPDPDLCKNGEGFNDKENGFYYLCISGKEKTKYEFLTVQGIPCTTNCPNPLDSNTQKNNKLWSDPSIWPNGVLPQEGADVLIDASWNLKLDIDPPKLGLITVMGNLYFDETRDESHLKAKQIWVRGGKIQAGGFGKEFTKKIKIELFGTKNDRALTIDDTIDASNKVLAVTGGLELYGIPPETVWTRLVEEADVGATSIKVESVTGWQVGDQIVISPSGMNPQQHEKLSIISIDQNQITFTPALKYYHYGAPQITIEKEGFGKLDMRATVGHITRNIKIIGNNENDNAGWGCRVLVYQFKEQNNLPRRGYVKLQGVEFDNCGQLDTNNAGLDFRYLNYALFEQLEIDNYESYIVKSIVQGCSFHDSNGQLLSAINSHQIEVNNNFFYYGRRALVQMIEGKKNYFKNNLMIYVMQRTEIDSSINNWAALLQFNTDVEQTEDNFYTTDNMVVSGNVGMGSEDTGFHFMATPCTFAEKNAFFDNYASAVRLSAIAYRQTNKNCVLIQNVGAFHSGQGIQASLYSEETKIQNIVLAENVQGINFKPATDDQFNNYNNQKNWYITALARPECIKCYSESLGSMCKNQIGFQLGAISTTSFPPINSKPSDNADSICTLQILDGRMFLDNVIFDNFKLKYNNLDKCGNNFVFQQHPQAFDTSMGHYLKNTFCNNCDEDAKFGFLSPDESKIGWFGGCGSMVCTGQRNVLIHDQDGSYLGKKAMVISDNRDFGDNSEYCTRKEKWNGYLCDTENLGNLLWLSIAPDYNKRLFSPVTLTNGKFKNIINSFKEWDWHGPEPLNRRHSKFIAVVELKQEIEMTNAGQNPTDAKYFLQKKNIQGTLDDWVIIKLKYSTPESIQVLVNNEIKKPNLIKGDVIIDLKTQTSICGSNNYFRKTNEIHFVVNAAEGCIVQVRQINSVFLSSRLEIDIETFFADDAGPLSFITKISGFLNIDPSRVKIVGARSGSTILDFQVDHQAPIGEQKDNVQQDPIKIQDELKTMADLIATKIESGETGYKATVIAKEVNVVTDFEKWETTEPISDDDPGDSTQIKDTSQAVKQSTNEASLNQIIVLVGISIFLF